MLLVAISVHLQLLELVPSPARRGTVGRSRHPAGFEPLAAPDEQFAGGGYARVELSLLNETTGAKLAQHGGTTKGRIKVRETSHTPDKSSPKPAESPGEKPAESHGEKAIEPKPKAKSADDGNGSPAAAANPAH